MKHRSFKTMEEASSFIQERAAARLAAGKEPRTLWLYKNVLDYHLAAEAPEVGWKHVYRYEWTPIAGREPMYKRFYNDKTVGYWMINRWWNMEAI